MAQAKGGEADSRGRPTETQESARLKVCGDGITSCKPSTSKKKNALSFLIGPPIEPAYWFVIHKGARGDLASGKSVLLIAEVVVGIQNIAVPPVDRVAVEVVGTGLGDVVHVGTGQAAVGSAIAIGNHSALGNIVQTKSKVGCAAIVNVEVGVIVIRTVDT